MSISGKVFIHPSSIIDEGAEIGEGSRIWHFCHVMGRARIGPGCSFGQNVFVGNVTIGANVKVQNNVSIYDGVTIEDDVFCGPSMVFTNVINPRAEIARKDELKPTLVKRGVSIGANATIVCGVTLGEYAFVGAGAVVREDVPPYALVVGVPAVVKGWVCSCGVRLHIAVDAGSGALVACQACGMQFESHGGAVLPVTEGDLI